MLLLFFKATAYNSYLDYLFGFWGISFSFLHRTQFTTWWCSELDFKNPNNTRIILLILAVLQNILFLPGKHCICKMYQRLISCNPVYIVFVSDKARHTPFSNSCKQSLGRVMPFSALAVHAVHSIFSTHSALIGKLTLHDLHTFTF
jgi:hypothetical protein